MAPLLQGIQNFWLCFRCQNWSCAMLNKFLLSRGVEMEREKPGMKENWHASSCPDDINNLVPVTSLYSAVVKRENTHSITSLLLQSSRRSHALMWNAERAQLWLTALSTAEKEPNCKLWAWITCGESQVLKFSQMCEQKYNTQEIWIVWDNICSKELPGGKVETLSEANGARTWQNVIVAHVAYKAPPTQHACMPRHERIRVLASCVAKTLKVKPWAQTSVVH